MRFAKLIASIMVLLLGLVSSAVAQVDVRGSWVATLSGATIPTQYFTISTQTGGSITGEGNAGSNTWDLTGSITANTIFMTWAYRDNSNTVTLSGTVSPDGQQITNGTWSDSYYTGTWTADRQVVPPAPTLLVRGSSPSFSGKRGGPFRPKSRALLIRASSGTVQWSVKGVPTWLSVSRRSGVVGTSSVRITVKPNSRAKRLRRSTIARIRFVNIATNQTVQRSVRMRVRSAGDALSDLELRIAE